MGNEREGARTRPFFGVGGAGAGAVDGGKFALANFVTSRGWVGIFAYEVTAKIVTARKGGGLRVSTE